MKLTAPDSVKAELKRGLKWHEEGHSGDGLKSETVAWATRLADGEPISEQKARDMRAWFARHESDKSGKGYKPDEEGYPSPGRVAWALWGGDPAVGWSAKLVNYFEDKNVNKYYDPYRAAYDPPDLPTPCTPADLTPTMAVAMPPELQAEFCARWNALTGEVPAGAGMDDDMAYWCALDLCRANGWMQNADGSWAKIVVVGGTPENEGVEKAGRMLSAANYKAMHDAANMIEKGCGMVRKMMDESGNEPIPVEVPMDMAKAIPFKIDGNFVSFTKADDAHRVAYGYGVVATVNGEVVKDSQDDMIIDLNSMEKSALNYALSNKAGKLMHKGDAAYSVPFVMPMTKEIAKANGMKIEKEGILIGMHFPNTPEGDKGWEMAKDGGGFSVGGKGSRTPV